MLNSGAQLKEVTYFVKNMHCASCEVLIEKKLLKEKGIKSADASTNKNNVRIEYLGEKPSTQKLNDLFKEDDYTFSTKEDSSKKQKRLSLKNITYTLGMSSILIVLFLLISKSDILAKVSVNSQSSLLLFILFGLLAGVSSCAALIGGIILAMAKQWNALYAKEETVLNRAKPHFLFNIGRLSSFFLVGGILGSLGQFLRISSTVYAGLAILISIIMGALALQMLGVKSLKISMPKVLTRFIADEKNFSAKYMPFAMGALTVLLPCGFTLTTQGLAVTSANPWQGAMIMTAFALGTTLPLIVIGVSSTELLRKPHFSNMFLKIAGILVLFFAFYNINAQLNVLGLVSVDDLNRKGDLEYSKDGFVPIVKGKQIIKMDAFSYKYEPNYFKVKPNIPVKMEITDKGTSGCTNAVISRALFTGEIKLITGKTSVKEFTPTKAGRYKFSCWMGMVSGVIEVATGENGTNVSQGSEVVVPSGTNSATCGGGSSCGGSCGGGCGNPGCSYVQ